MGGLGALRPPAHASFKVQRAGPDSTLVTAPVTLLLPEYDPLRRWRAPGAREEGRASARDNYIIPRLFRSIRICVRRCCVSFSTKTAWADDLVARRLSDMRRRPRVAEDDVLRHLQLSGVG